MPNGSPDLFVPKKGEKVVTPGCGFREKRTPAWALSTVCTVSNLETQKEEGQQFFL